MFLLLKPQVKFQSFESTYRVFPRSPILLLGHLAILHSLESHHRSLLDMNEYANTLADLSKLDYHGNPFNLTLNDTIVLFEV